MKKVVGCNREKDDKNKTLFLDFQVQTQSESFWFVIAIKHYRECIVTTEMRAKKNAICQFHGATTIGLHFGSELQADINSSIA